jgi:hypothetical protein
MEFCVNFLSQSSVCSGFFNMAPKRFGCTQVQGSVARQSEIPKQSKGIEFSSIETTRRGFARSLEIEKKVYA